MSRVLVGGTANYMQMSDGNAVLDPTTNAFTCGIWAKLDSNSGVSQVFFAKWNGSTGWIMFMLASGVVRAQINTTNVDDAGAAPIGSWVHFMLRRDASTLKLYRNGVEVGSNGSPASMSNTTHPFYWGHRTSGTTSAARGQFAEFAAWSAILTPAEIAAVAAGASPMLVRPASLVYIPGWGVGAGTEPDLAGGAFTLGEVGTVAVADHAPVRCPFPVAT